MKQRLSKVHMLGCPEVYPLILTDINMPEMDGIQMTIKIRKILSQSGNLQSLTSFIWAVTAMNDEAIKEHVQPEMLDGVSFKPLS